MIAEFVCSGLVRINYHQFAQLDHDCLCVQDWLESTGIYLHNQTMIAETLCSRVVGIHCDPFIKSDCVSVESVHSSGAV